MSEGKGMRIVGTLSTSLTEDFMTVMNIAVEPHQRQSLQTLLRIQTDRLTRHEITHAHVPLLPLHKRLYFSFRIKMIHVL